MKIYLLLLDHARFFFYSDESEATRETADAEAASTKPHSGLYGWCHARYTKFRSAWQHADSGALRWMHQAWDWLHTWAHPDEVMLARLWSVRQIELHYPAARPADQVQAIWSEYLRKQWWRHLVWLIVNGTIAPFSIIFALLPGPNLIGYWFAYRAVHHALVVWGIRRVMLNKVPTDLYPVGALDLPIQRDDDGKSRHVVLTGKAVRLDDHVAWHRSPGRPKSDGDPSVAPTTAGEPRPANSQNEPSRDR